MTAKAVTSLPVGACWAFEPKFNGYRAIVFRTTTAGRPQVVVQSRQQRMLTAHFPDNPAEHMGDARCNGSAPANNSAVMSDTVRGDVHELTLRLSPGSPAGSRRHACDCTTV